MEDGCLKKTKEIRIILILRMVRGKGEDNSSRDVVSHKIRFQSAYIWKYLK